MGRRRRTLPAAQAEVAAREAAGHLRRCPELERCRQLVLYAALPDELPTRPLYDAGRRAGKPLLWPRLVPGGGLEFAPCAAWEDLQPGRYGVLAPPAGTPGRGLVAGDLVLVPGLAFDAAGRRLGRGGGHYDRALAARAGESVAFGVGFGFQCVEEVPAGPRDQPVDAVLTERGIWRGAAR